MKKFLLLMSILFTTVFAQNSNIVPVKETFFNINYNDIKIENNYAFLATDAKFLIFDITNRTNPSIISTIDVNNSLLRMYKENDLFYIPASASGVAIFDVFNKKSPQLLSFINTSDAVGKVDSAVMVTKFDSYLFIADFNKGIKIFDIADIHAPLFINKFLENEIITKIEKVGDKKLLISILNKGIFCYDVANVDSVSLLGQFLTPASSLIIDFAVKNKTAYVTDYNIGIRVLNITNLSQITQVSIKTETQYPYAIDVYNNRLVVIKNDFALLKNTTNLVSGFDIFDITNETTPNYLSSVNASGSKIGSQDLNYVYLLSDKSFMIYDITNISQPKIKYIMENFGEINDVFVENNLAYISSSGRGLVICDISLPESPQLLTSYKGGGSVYSATKRDSLIYLACDSSFQVINVKNISNIQKVGGYNYNNFLYKTNKINICGDTLAYVCGGTLPGLSMLNIKNKNNIVETDRYGYGITPYSIFDDVISSDTNIYSVNHYNGFYVLSLSPNYLFTINAIVGEGGNAGITYNNKVYLAGGNEGIKIMNVSNPYLPTLMSKFPTLGDARSVIVSGTNAFVANGDKGIDIADVSNSYSPFRVARYQTRGNASKLFIKDNLIFLAEKSLFSIYQYQDMPVNLTLISPNGGEIWKRGSIRNITWSSNKIQGEVNIFISFDHGVSYYDTIATNVTNNGIYEWTIPMSYPLSSYARVKIESNNNTDVNDVSESNFTISMETDVIENKFLTYSLSQNYPNPFNPSTKINFSLAKSGNVKIEVFDILGTKVKTLVDEYKNSGNYTIDFKAENLSSGIYIYRIQSNEFTKIMKMNFLK